MFIEYTASRSLVTTAGLKTISVNINSDSSRAVFNGATQVSISGVTQTILHRIDSTNSVSTVPIKDEAIQAQMVEFLDSVIAGETFSVDVYGDGTNAVPAILSPVAYTPTRVQRIFMQYAFSFRQL